MNQERKLTFGKYKGQDIKYIILTHIGYIMWCFENISWFKLTDEEQALYDAVAIMIKRDNLEMTFPTEIMYKYIKDREALRDLKTPFICNGDFTSVRKRDIDSPIVKSVMKYNVGAVIESRKCSTLSDLYCLNHSMNKEIERARFNGETDEDIFGGWGSMNDYKD
ncbi:hypothetical protein [Bacteroides fragilis]|jgi:hypothetical protein|uniref:Exodeoxyribonuclease X-like C-terminal domain-containing protein n=1 Tax=Bacteroides fragilis TaxID=817 RepID=A0A412YGH5_BACFG|nr:hypothetical protein [Bacteroides fragilis]RGV56508.1 hypothetical protein DWW08_05870 [Bacteroides fragilis]RGV81063.1 hypothetical protein DWW00_22805 [Bacteroides fragilis]